jgi:flagellar biosynthesis chaperone FliJ
MKTKEIIEEFAKNKYGEGYNTVDIRHAFVDGAEYQAKRMYSEEDMRKAYDQGIDDSFDIGFSSKDDTNFNVFIEQFKKK